jgi:hypothetical protein
VTLLLAHPEAEDLGRFVEGTLDDPERAAIVDHIADCDDCRILVVDAAEFIEPAKVERHSNWWMGIAASVVIAVSVGSFWYVSRDPLVPVRAVSSKLTQRPTEARLAGFPFVELNRKRGGGDDTIDTAELELDGKIGDVLERQGDDPKTLHAKGVAHLLAAWRLTQERDVNVDEVKKERTEAVAELHAAADRAPDNAAYQTDLAAALLTIDDKNSDLALVHLKKALSIDPRNPEALFNQALALRDSNPKAAIAAFKSYLDVDPSSKWAEEARRDLEILEEAP